MNQIQLFGIEIQTGAGGGDNVQLFFADIDKFGPSNNAILLLQNRIVKIDLRISRDIFQNDL